MSDKHDSAAASGSADTEDDSSTPKALTNGKAKLASHSKHSEVTATIPKSLEGGTLTPEKTIKDEDVERDEFGLPIRKAKQTPEDEIDESEEEDEEGFEDALEGRDDAAHEQGQEKQGAALSEENNKKKEDRPEHATPNAKQEKLPDEQASKGEEMESKKDDEEVFRKPSLPASRAVIKSASRENEEQGMKGEQVEEIELRGIKHEQDIDSSKNVNHKEQALQEADGERSPTSPQTKRTSAYASHSRNFSTASAASRTTDTRPMSEQMVLPRELDTSPAGMTSGFSEWSHQRVVPRNEGEEAGAAEGKKEENEWQEMPAYAPFPIYNDAGKLVAKQQESDDEGDGDVYAALGGAGRGYTRVTVDDDALSATSMDEDTAYLFKEAGRGGKEGLENGEYDDEEEQRDPMEQMQFSKDLLTEGQKIAYVGIVRLATMAILASMAEVAETKGTKKELRIVNEALKMWSQKIMVRLYAHMEISSAEQLMIEQLSEHGVLPGDLTPMLMQNARVKNPMADKKLPDVESSSPRPSSTLSRSSISKEKADEPSPDGASELSVPPPPPYKESEEEQELSVTTPSGMSDSKNIDIDLRWTVLCDLFLVLIADSVYDARSRVLLERVGEYLDVPWLSICKFEKRVTEALEMQEAPNKENWNEDEHMEHRRKLALKKRYMMMGLATVGGTLVIGLSAGLLAPVIGAGLAAGFTTIGVAGTSSFLAGAGGAAIITSSAGLAGGIIAVRASNRRTGAVKTFEYRPLHNNKRVNLIVTVSGWMTGKVDDVRLPFSTVDPVMGDIYSVLWEPEVLQSVGETLNIIATEALTQGLQQVLASTLLMGLMAALQLPIVLSKLAYLIDNPWSVSVQRADATGLILADSLIERNLGSRPVTLVGYSLGSRVIFSCLRELAAKGAYGIIQNVYLFGSPVVVKKDEYLRARAIIAGRFVNGYARNDWLLGYLFRATGGGLSQVAGLAPIQGIAGLENIEVTSIVNGHFAYRAAIPKLLREIGWLVTSDTFTEIEEPDPEDQARQRELIVEIDEARRNLEEGTKKKRFGIFSRTKAAPKKKAWETYDEDAAKDAIAAEADANAKGHERQGSEGTGSNMLFDIDAIRRELESERMDVKELESTLPPIVLNLSGDGADSQTSGTHSGGDGRRSTSNGLMQEPGVSSSSSQKHSVEKRPSSLDIEPEDFQPTDLGHSPLPIKYIAPLTFPETQKRPSMEHSVTHQPDIGRHSTLSLHPHQRQNGNIETKMPDDGLDRPSARTTASFPAIGTGAGLEHNAWVDEDDEFKEKEVTMSFE